MNLSNNLSDRHKIVRKEFSNKLGLELTDIEINKLIEGESLSIEQLMENRTLTQVGTALIRLDALSATKQCPEGSTYIWPFGCVNDTIFTPRLQISSDSFD
jgi:hypothetical protein